jgi:hypothetical protein
VAGGLAALGELPGHTALAHAGLAAQAQAARVARAQFLEQPGRLLQQGLAAEEAGREIAAGWQSQGRVSLRRRR